MLVGAAVFNSPEVAVNIEEGTLKEFNSSKAVVRKRCPKCFSPVLATLFKGKFTAVTLSLFSWDEQNKCPEVLKPTHHIYYGCRVVDVEDGLPKHDSRYSD